VQNPVEKRKSELSTPQALDIDAIDALQYKKHLDGQAYLWFLNEIINDR